MAGALPLVQHTLMLDIFAAHRLHQDASRRFSQQINEPQVEFLLAESGDSPPEGAHLESLQAVVKARLGETLADAVIHHVIDHQAKGLVYHLKRKG